MTLLTKKTITKELITIHGHKWSIFNRIALSVF